LACFTYSIGDGTADSLNKAIIAIDELREIIIEIQFNVPLDETCSVYPDFLKGAGK
jgi:hypothetical protein